ncbi:hypothetical protein, partial [Enorma massiliensis]
MKRLNPYSGLVGGLSAGELELLSAAVEERRLREEIGVGTLAEAAESAPNPLTGRVPLRHHCRCGGTEADHGKTVPEARGGVQAARRAAVQREGDRLRGGRASRERAARIMRENGRA